jgi:hypothetical protein
MLMVSMPFPALFDINKIWEKYTMLGYASRSTLFQKNHIVSFFF